MEHITEHIANAMVGWNGFETKRELIFCVM